MTVTALFSELGFSALAILLLALFALSLSAYIKIVTVLGIVRAGLGAESLPSALVTGALAIVLSFFVMYPTIVRSGEAMEGPLQSSLTENRDTARVVAIEAGLDVWKEFLKRHAGESEVARFSKVAEKLDSGSSRPVSDRSEDVVVWSDSWRVLAPAFLVSELKEAFATGLSLLLPFVIIDLLVAIVLGAVGLERLSPAVVGLPFKLLLFVMVDGWALITTNLVSSYS
jgi:type III secretory pathway component EscR